MPIEKIAQMRNLTSETILTHIEKLCAKGLPLSVVEYLKPNPDRFETIVTAFKQTNDNLLILFVKLSENPTPTKKSAAPESF